MAGPSRRRAALCSRPTGARCARPYYGMRLTLLWHASHPNMACVSPYYGMPAAPCSHWDEAQPAHLTASDPSLARAAVAEPKPEA
eukprot:3032944-Prymnesium_polylepis.1